MTDDLTPSRGRLSPRLTPASLAATYSLGAHRAIIDAADGHAAAPMLRALAHIGGLAHAAAGYPRHLLSPLRDVLAAVDRLPDAAALAAWALGEMPAGDVEPRPDGEVAALRARAEAAERELAQARAEGEAAGRTAERVAVVAMLRGGAHSHRGFGVSLIAGELERYADTIGAGAHVGAAGGAA